MSATPRALAPEDRPCSRGGRRRATLRALLAGLGLSVFAGAAPSEAWADDSKAPDVASSDDASERFRAGVAFYKDGDFTAALVEFKRAYELSPNYRVLFNLGQTSQELNDYASALTAFEQYLAEGGDEVDAKRRTQVEAWMASLRKKVGRVKLTTNVDGAELFVDDLPVGVSPLEPAVVVNAGRRKFGATAKGHTPTSRVVEIAGTDETELALELVPIDSSKPKIITVEKTVPGERRESSGSAAPWVAFSITAAAAIGTGVFGGLALSASGERDDELARFPASASAIADASDRTKTFALVTDVLAGVTAAGAITTIVLFAATGSSSDDDDAKSASRVDLRVSPTGLSLIGTF